MIRVKKLIDHKNKFGMTALFYYVLYIGINKYIHFFKKIQCFFYRLFNQAYFNSKKNCIDLKRNLRLKNKHARQHAMVVGTGRSARQLLDGAYDLGQTVIITVNEGFLFLIQHDIVPNYVIINDDQYYQDKLKWQTLCQLFDLVSRYRCVALLPIRHKEKLVPLLTQENQNYIHFYDTFPSDKENVDWMHANMLSWDSPLPNLPTVVHFSLILSLYLGCQKTYLLGVDMDYMVAPTSPIQHCYDGMQGFELSHQSCIEEYQHKMQWSFEELLNQTQIQLCYYRVIRDIFQQLNCSIINLSKTGFLQAFMGELNEEK